MKLVLFIPLIFLISCFSSSNEKIVIDKNKIDYIEIRKRVDTVSLRLSDDQFQSFLTKLESSVSKKTGKVFAEYHLIFHFKDGGVLTADVRNDIIRESGGRTYSIGDKEFFKNTWFQQAGLTHNHYEYFPTYKNEGDFTQVIETLDTENLERIKQILTDYGHEWVEVRGILFYEGYLSEEQLAYYTSKARRL